MTITVEKNLLENYISMFDSFNLSEKKEIIDRLKLSSRKHEKTTKNFLEKSFGAWEDDRSAEEIIADINSDLHFSGKVLEL